MRRIAAADVETMQEREKDAARQHHRHCPLYNLKFTNRAGKKIAGWIAPPGRSKDQGG
jgi:hypothetical protein